jgi:hypothetical protein
MRWPLMPASGPGSTPFQSRWGKMMARMAPMCCGPASRKTGDTAGLLAAPGISAATGIPNSLSWKQTGVLPKRCTASTHIGNNDLSTAFQFASLVGVGLGFGGRGQYELSYRFTHFSNADIKQPNDGIDMHLLKLGYNFN